MGVRKRKNKQGLTEEELKIADTNGITRRLALRRKRLLYWENIDCITIPNQGKGRPRKDGKIR